MTDPVRPVAPREDEWKRAAELINRAVKTFCSQADNGVICTPSDDKDGFPQWDAKPHRTWCEACRRAWHQLFDARELLNQLAAAPVPCAASPGDMIAFVEEKAAKARKDHAWRVEDAACWRDQSDDDQREAAALAQRMSGRKTATVPKAERDRLAQISDRIGAKRLAEAEMYEAILNSLRATGDDTFRRNADPVSGGAEVDGAGTGAADRHQHRDTEPDRARARDGRGHATETASVDAQQAPPVAVARDPHRLLDEISERLAKRRAPQVGTCASCGHRQEMAPMYQTLASSMAIKQWECQACGGQNYVTATIGGNEPTQDEDIATLLEQLTAWIARFNQLPEIVARAEERGRLRGEAAARASGGAVHATAGEHRVAPSGPDSEQSTTTAEIEAWQQRVIEFAEVYRDGESVCRWCAVNRGFHYRGCPVGNFLTAVQVFVDALKRNGGMSQLPLPPRATGAGARDDINK